MALHEKVRVGDVIGTASIFSNIFWNFIKLWWMRDFEYAKQNWKNIVPTKFYVVCKARGTDLLYASTAIKKMGKADVVFRSLERLGHIVYAGRCKCFGSMKSSMDLNASILNTHYYLHTEYDVMGAMETFYTNKINNKWLDKKFVVFAMGIGGHKWHDMATLKYYKPNALELVELGDFDAIPM